MADAADTPMPRLADITGNAHARRLLRQAVAENRLFPVLLFRGPAGVGKLTTARAVAAALNCREGMDGACGRCAPCHKIASWTHPDIKVLESEASALAAGRPLFFPASRPPDEAGGGGRDSRSSSSRPSARLLVGQVRRLLREVGFRPFEGRRRVLLLRDLESDPGQGCANMLLKTLEEPPPDTQFILTSSRAERLPETVRSRCQELPFVPASRGEVEAFLTQRGIEPDAARLRAALSGGLPGAALALDTDTGLELRDRIMDSLEQAATGGALAAVTVAQELGRGRQELPNMLRTLALVCRDLMLVSEHAGAREQVINVDRVGKLEELADHITAAGAARLLERLPWCERAAERNVNATLMLQNLLLEIGGHMPEPLLTSPWVENEAPAP